MDRNQVELASALISATVPVARTMVNQKMRERRLENQKESQIEILEAKERADTGGGSDLAEQMAAATASEDSSDWDESIRQLQAQTDCEVCSSLLDGIRELPAEDRGLAISEYGRFQDQLEHADEDEIRETLEQSPALRRALELEFGQAPS
jgi:hypothetical protein